ncbi:ABC transporter permease [bacterium]|nr:ABC transporter permease [bacterium]
MQIIRYLVIKEFRQIFRDHMMARIIILIPFVQLLILGYAVNTDLKNVKTAIVDQDHTPQSRQLIKSMYASDLFLPAKSDVTPDNLEDRLGSDQVDLILWIPRGYAEAQSRHQSAQVGVFLDGRNSSIAGRAGGYTLGILRQENQRLLENSTLNASAFSLPIGRITATTRFFYNPDLTSRDYMIPGIVALIVTIITAFLTGMAVVKEKEVGTLEQLMVTPITPLQLIAGKTIPFLILGMIELTFATLFAVLYFKLPFTGSILLLFLGALLYIMVTLSVGVFASAVSRTQQQAMFTVWFFLVYGILTSGFFYPLENMPAFVQYLTYINPLRYFLPILRGLFLKGVGFFDIWDEYAALLTLGILFFSAAVIRFKKTVE